MHTNLSVILKALSNGILDPYVFPNTEYSGINQMSFFTAVFPLYFLNSEENKAMLQVTKNNSSRLSNLFTRQTDPKRRESKFRERFLEAFDKYFFEEMLLSTKFILRNYNSDKFENWIEDLLTLDTALKEEENMFFYRQLSNTYKKSPEYALALLILWAFHIGDFKDMIHVIEDLSLSSSSTVITRSEDNKALDKLIEDYHLNPMDVYDFIDIAYKYGISGYLGAIAIKTYVDSHTHNNPLISSELADMYFYGNNFLELQKDKAMNLYTINANSGYGPAMWSIGQISSNERFDINQTPVKFSMHYYERAIDQNHALSYNNIGKWWIYALHYHVYKSVGVPGYQNIYVNQGRQAVSDIYNIMISRVDFNSFLDHYGFTKTVDFQSLSPEEIEALLTRLEDAENYIVDHFIMQAYIKQRYFFSLGSCVTLYENQLNRRKSFTEKYGLKPCKDKENASWEKYVYHVSEYSKYQISSAQLIYAKYLMQINAEPQDIYEYLYKAAYELPGNELNHEAMLEFLIYHVDPRVVYKKNQINFDKSLMATLEGYRPNYQSKTYHALNAVKLMLSHLKASALVYDAYEFIIDCLNAEALAHPEEKALYESVIDQFIRQFKL